MKWGRLALALFFAAAPALARGSDDYAGVHTIAVVSMLKNELQLQIMGLTVFDKSSNTVATGWDLQSAIVRRAAAALGDRFQLRGVTLPADTFDNINPGLFGNYGDMLAERVAALPRLEGVDAYLIVFPNPGINKDKARGLFVHHDAGLLTGRGTVIEVPYDVVIYQAGTGKILGSGFGRIPWADTFSSYGTPSEACADELWPATPEALTPRQRTRLHQEMFSLIERSFPIALYNAGLLSEAAATGLLASATPAEPSCRGIP